MTFSGSEYHAGCWVQLRRRRVVRDGGASWSSLGSRGSRGFARREGPGGCHAPALARRAHPLPSGCVLVEWLSVGWRRWCRAGSTIHVHRCARTTPLPRSRREESQEAEAPRCVPQGCALVWPHKHRVCLLPRIVVSLQVLAERDSKVPPGLGRDTGQR